MHTHKPIILTLLLSAAALALCGCSGTRTPMDERNGLRYSTAVDGTPAHISEERVLATYGRAANRWTSQSPAADCSRQETPVAALSNDGAVITRHPIVIRNDLHMALTAAAIRGSWSSNPPQRTGLFYFPATVFLVPLTCLVDFVGLPIQGLASLTLGPCHDIYILYQSRPQGLGAIAMATVPFGPLTGIEAPVNNFAELPWKPIAGGKPATVAPAELWLADAPAAR